MHLQKVREATKADETLQEVIKLVTTGGEWAKNEEINKFKFVKEELSVADGLVLRGDRVVIPKKLQRKVVKLAHGSHQGIVKTKALLRETVWFPGMDRLTEEIVRECIPCQANSNKMIQAPLQMTPLPSGEWNKVSADFYGPLQSGDYLLVVMDDYSR